MNWEKYAPFFTQAEFACKHTGLCKMDEQFMEALLAVRRELGQPLQITSGYRDPSHPVEAAKKGKAAGEHTLGRAADIACSTGAQRYSLLTIALKHGFNRFGVAEGFIHLGLGGPSLPPRVVWMY